MMIRWIIIPTQVASSEVDERARADVGKASFLFVFMDFCAALR